MGEGCVTRACACHKAWLTWCSLVPQELPLILSLASAGAISRLPTMALFVFVVQASRIEVACALADGEQVAGSFTLVDSKLAGCVLNALPLLQKPAGSSW